MVASRTQLALALGLALAAATASAQFSGDGTDYGGNVQGGACGFSKLWPAWTSTSMGLTAAINAPQWNAAMNCGRCARVQHGTNDPVIVQIVDKCPECKQGDLDFASGAYAAIIKKAPGREKISWSFVDCPETFVKGDVSIRIKEGSNPHWVAFNPNNFKVGVTSMEINTGSSWTKLNHDDNSITGLYFTYTSGITGPYKLRLNGLNGESIESPSFTGVTSDLAFGKQFGSSAGGATSGTSAPATLPVTDRTTSSPAATTAAPAATTTRTPTATTTKTPTATTTKTPTWTTAAPASSSSAPSSTSRATATTKTPSSTTATTTKTPTATTTNAPSITWPSVPGFTWPTSGGAGSVRPGGSTTTKTPSKTKKCNIRQRKY